MVGDRTKVRNCLLRPSERWDHVAVRTSGGATNAGANACHGFVVADHSPGLDIGQARFDRLSDVDLVHQVIPAGVLGEGIDEAVRFWLDIARIGHD